MYWYGRLPHWVPENSTVFVTWRLAGRRQDRRRYQLVFTEQEKCRNSRNPLSSGSSPLKAGFPGLRPCPATAPSFWLLTSNSSTSTSSCRCWRLQQLHLQHRMQFNAGQLGHPGLPVIGIEETDSGDADLGRRNRGLEGRHRLL